MFILIILSIQCIRQRGVKVIVKGFLSYFLSSALSFFIYLFVPFLLPCVFPFFLSFFPTLFPPFCLYLLLSPRLFTLQGVEFEFRSFPFSTILSVILTFTITTPIPTPLSISLSFLEFSLNILCLSFSLSVKLSVVYILPVLTSYSLSVFSETLVISSPLDIFTNHISLLI